MSDILQHSTQVNSV
ncbi:hypothetical protein CIB84_012373 [Bambusicola thoracicus]|uniref:Uncharacterized protein n=1 Tax=Bambusicola thoracicus TaxID=9083 RepID=A0A2P4SIE4_BAMTH|nr:hypothetical protein CIB84_012373 [Bambusicola thoracicus]